MQKNRVAVRCYLILCNLYLDTKLPLKHNIMFLKGLFSIHIHLSTQGKRLIYKLSEEVKLTWGGRKQRRDWLCIKAA